MIRLLADADFQPRHREGLPPSRARDGFLLRQWAKLEGVPDPEVLALAADQDRILVTHDRKTMPWHFGAFLMSADPVQACFSSASTRRSGTSSMRSSAYGPPRMPEIGP